VYVDLDGHYAQDAEWVQSYIKEEEKCANGDCDAFETMREENTRLNNELQDCSSLADCRAKVSDAEASLENLQDRYEQIQEYRRKGLTVDPQTGTDLQREFYKLGDFIAGDSGSWAYNRARTSIRKHANLEGAELTAEEELYKWESVSLPLISISGRGAGGLRNQKPSLIKPTKEMLKDPYHPDWKKYSGTEYRDIGAAQAPKLTGSNWKFDPKKDLDLRGAGSSYRDALDEAFKRTGVPRDQFKVTKWGRDQNGKSIPVEYSGPGGASVNMDIPKWNNVKANGSLGEGPHQPHIGYQTSGKGSSRVRGHIFVEDIPATRK
jgi:hypothetical protein